MKILNVEQLRALDEFTIRNEPVASIDLMERAATACFEWISEHFGTDGPFVIWTGPGNNGGDGLAIARMISNAGGKVTVVCDTNSSGSPDYQINLARLKQSGNAEIVDFEAYDWDPGSAAVGIDAIFGYGLNRSAEGKWKEYIQSINSLPNIVLSIDLPSGLFADKPSGDTIVRADFTLTFQVPKLAFFIPENQDFVGEWIVLDIGLDNKFLETLDSPWRLLEMHDVAPLIRQRKKFDHKGIYGHALLIAGSFGKVGAAILAARAALRSGVGLLTIHAPRKACDILQITVPEAMVSADRHDFNFSGLDSTPEKITAIGMGCGLGIHGCTTQGIRQVLKEASVPVVIDADGLNTLARNPDLVNLIPEGTILTPHLKEFERIFDSVDNHFDRLMKLRSSAVERGFIAVLKGAHSAVALPDGNVFFNTTGNPGMATAGSGDVLTGVITGLLAQGYEPTAAALIGVYLHGLAGDIAHESQSDESLVSGDIIDNLGRAFKILHNN